VTDAATSAWRSPRPNCRPAKRALPGGHCRNLRAHGKGSVEAMDQGLTPLLLGGDHSMAAGLGGWRLGVLPARSERIGLIWFDAHSDINTPETSPSGNVHGMPLAALLGLGPEPLSAICNPDSKVAAENVVLIGLRDIDAAER